MATQIFYLSSKHYLFGSYLATFMCAIKQKSRNFDDTH